MILKLCKQPANDMFDLCAHVPFNSKGLHVLDLRTGDRLLDERLTKKMSKKPQAAEIQKSVT